MKNITIQIPNMQSAHCQMRVNNALKSIEGIQITEIKPGECSLEIENDEKQSIAIQAIKDAGYSVENVESDSKNSDDNETLQFKTNINCSSCVARVSPALNDLKEISNWDVDTSAKEKILSIHSQGISTQEIIETVQNAGFTIEPLKK